MGTEGNIISIVILIDKYCIGQLEMAPSEQEAAKERRDSIAVIVWEETPINGAIQGWFLNRAMQVLRS